MAKTVPQLKKIDRADPELVETISGPYEWQRKMQQGHARKPEPGTPELHIKTIPIGKNPRRR